MRQDPEDRTAFFMLQRFPSPEAMSSYQNTDTFQAFTDVSFFLRLAFGSYVHMYVQSILFCF